MALFDFLFKNRPKPQGNYQGEFKMLNGYVPRFTTRGGGIYESELIRAAINARATHISKLKIELKGAARPTLQARLKHAPNQFQPPPSSSLQAGLRGICAYGLRVWELLDLPLML